MIPEVGMEEYFDGLLERAWDIFSEELYDEVPAGEISGEDSVWSYDQFEGSDPTLMLILIQMFLMLS